MSGLVRIAIAAVLGVLIWRAIDGPAALALLGEANPLSLILALALLSAQILLSALRWSLCARALGQDLPWRAAAREYHLGMLLNLSLPGGVMGDAGRALRTSAGHGLAGAATSVVIERLSGQLTLALILGVGLVVWSPVAPWGPRIAGIGLVGALGAIVLVSLGPAPLRRFGRGFARCWWPRPRLLAQGLVNIGIVACAIGAMAACSAAVGAPLGLAALVVVPLALLAMLLPVSVGGWGLREGAAAVFWPLAGQSPEAAIAASIAFGTLALVAALPGLLVTGRGAGPLDDGADGATRAVATGPGAGLQTGSAVSKTISSIDSRDVTLKMLTSSTSER